jgi:ABC-2 type transport system permease protein
MRETFNNAWIIAKREFRGYFATPLAAVFLTIFVALTGALAFYIGGFFERGQADLYPFFAYHPWLYLFLVPAVAMRLWAEERKSGTIELLMTLPVSPFEAVLGKFLAAWAFIGLALALTFPMWLTANYLGDPDNGVIAASYLGSFLMAGAFLAIGSFISALTKNQVIAFILAATVCFLFVLSGMEMVQNTLRAWLPEFLVTALSSMSFLSHYEQITRGVVSLHSLIFFASLIAFSLFANVIAIDQKKAA